MAKKLWTNEEKDILKNVYNEMEREDILKLFPDRNWGSLTKMAQVMGIANRNNNPNISLKNYRKPNEVIVHEDYAEIVIKIKSGEKFYIKIDLDDVENVSKYKWTIKRDHSLIYIRHSYRVERNVSKEIMIHRLISNPKEDEVVDHINGDTLDNRKCNLRNVSPNENAKNKTKSKTITGIVGISLKRIKSGKSYIYKYYVSLQYNGIKVFQKQYPNNEFGLQQAIIDNNFARDYVFNKNENIPEYIKNTIDRNINNKKKYKSKGEKLRENILKRDNFYCKGCSKYFGEENSSNIHVHHILPKYKFPELEFNPNNLISLCKDCHESIKNRELDCAHIFNLIIKSEGRYIK